MKALVVFGTRPEAIKLIPIAKSLKNSRICLTGQHKEMLYQVMDIFKIKANYDLKVMKKDQSLFELTSKILVKFKKVLEKEKPDVVVVQGDTTTTLAAALGAFYRKIPVAYVEAGLRSFDKYAPYPEEINRKLVTSLADIYFSPTKEAADNLRKEGIKADKIFVTGNTSIDALLLMIKKIKKEQRSFERYFKHEFGISFSRKTILVTGHRRENFGKGFRNICSALKEIALTEDVSIIYPVHLNPNVQVPVRKTLSNTKNVFLIPPMDYDKFCFLMLRANFIISDSGGVQEEAPSLGKPVLVTRDVTERKEGISAGNAVLVGTDTKKIISMSKKLLHSRKTYQKMSKAGNPYGDGRSAERVAKIIQKTFGK